jgi:hypothetical protein
MKVTNQPASRPTAFLLFFAGMLISLGSHAQGASDDNEVVMYDPLFWRDELSLKNDQSRRIEEINTEFYESIRLLRDEETDRTEKHEQLERGLQKRSEKIFEALLPKQRRKLEKIIDKTMPVAAP